MGRCRSAARTGGRPGGWPMPRYKFRWSNLPPDVLDGLCHTRTADGDDYDPAEALHDVYGARPKEDFIHDAWSSLLETWLKHDKESRDWVVTALRQTRHEDGTLTKRRDQLEYLRNLRNAKNLRA